VSTIFWSIPIRRYKHLNKYAILDLIRFTPGGISRVELARQLGLTRAAVTSIINDLVECGLVREAESHSAPTGRRPIVLEINPERGKVVGIDVGATHVQMLLADFSARVLFEYEAPIDITEGPEPCVAEIDRMLQRLLTESNQALDDIAAIGIGVPGPVVKDAGVVTDPPIMPGWDGFPIRDRLAQMWRCPVALNNDAELGALGEWAYGAGRGERNLAYIKIGTGIGAGLLLDGQIYGGTTGSAGEIGHITLNENGLLCSCGNRGCLETLVGGNAIARQAVEAVKSGQRTQLALIKPIETISARDVIAAARRGDLIAQRIMIEAGGHLGTAIASLVNLFNPGMVVVGGGVAQIGDLLLEPVRLEVRQRSLKAGSRAVRITTALLGRRSTGMGAVVEALTIALHRISEQKEPKSKADETDKEEEFESGIQG
jgi:glucokinase-like ROK family protein